MKSKPIYVETSIRTDLDTIWEHTQTPQLHRQWDLRFSEITYLSRRPDDDVQRFLYRTRIGFGLSISGTGVSKAAVDSPAGERISALRFGSEQALSLIRTGSGYWKYTPEGDHIGFVTRYDYQTRFGLIGEWFDRLLFRPLFGFATAWSFDLLRIWLEQRIPPAAIIQRAVIHYFCVMMITILWLFEGLVPKLLFPNAQELAMIRHTGWFSAGENQLLTLLGVMEVAAGVLAACFHRSKRIYAIQSVLLLLLAVPALIGSPGMIASPFNPLTLSGPMIVLSLIARWTADRLPDARHCLRKPAAAKASESEQGGPWHGIDLRTGIGF